MHNNSFSPEKIPGRKPVKSDPGRNRSGENEDGRGAIETGSPFVPKNWFSTAQQSCCTKVSWMEAKRKVLAPARSSHGDPLSPLLALEFDSL